MGTIRSLNYWFLIQDLMSMTAQKNNPHPIPFNRPFLVGKELDYIAQAVKAGHLSGDGPFTKKCHEFLETLHPGGRVLLTPSCTAALEMSAILSGICEGQTFISPSFTFVSSVNPFMLRGAKPIFVDIREDTLNIDETLIEAAIEDHTRSICVVHYGGVGAEMDAILPLAEQHDLDVIEDAAHALGATYKGKRLGTLGRFGAFSFHETKNYIAGEGGALLLNHDEDFHRAEIIREKGTNRSAFFRGEVDKYTWVDVGSSYLPSELIAAFLFAQLEEMTAIDTARLKIFERYAAELADLEQKGHLRLPHCPDDCKHTAHVFYALCESVEVRTQLIEHLAESGVKSSFHYVPLHLSPMGKKLGYMPGQLPVTESVAERLLRFPLYYEMTEADQTRVIAGVRDFFVGSQ